MTVAIAWERYVAVHYPLDYNQAVNDANAIRKRLLKYVGPTFFIAVGFNVVKFFEAKVRTHLETKCNSKPTQYQVGCSYESTFLKLCFIDKKNFKYCIPFYHLFLCLLRLSTRN